MRYSNEKALGEAFGRLVRITMIATPTLAHLTDADSLLQAAHREAYHLSESDLIQYLKGILGRPLIAHITGIADANNVSRWASGRARPDRGVWERLRTVATLHIAISEIVKSPTSAAQWFTGTNPYLGDKMPADELRAGHDAMVFAAVRDLAQR